MHHYFTDVNLLRHADTYLSWWIGSGLVKVMVSLLLCTKAVPMAALTYNQLVHYVSANPDPNPKRFSHSNLYVVSLYMNTQLAILLALVYNMEKYTNSCGMIVATVLVFRCSNIITCYRGCRGILFKLHKPQCELLSCSGRPHLWSLLLTPEAYYTNINEPNQHWDLGIKGNYIHHKTTTCVW